MLLCALCLLSGCGQSEAQPTKTQPADIAAEVQTQDMSALELVKDIATTQYFSDEDVADEDVETILMAGVNAPSAMNGQPWHFSVVSDAEVLQQISEGMGGGFGGMPPAGMDMPQAGKPGDMDFEAPGDMEPPEGFEFPGAPGNFPAEAGELSADMEQGTAPPAGIGGMSKAGLTDAPLAIIVSCKAGSELDAGLACQNMSVAAQLLGYGSKIISSPTMALNGANQAEYRELLSIPEDMSAVAVLLVGMEDTTVDESVDGYTGASVRNPLDDMVSYIK